MSTPDTFAAVRACCVALLAGAVLTASDVTAGNGSVIDWRAVRSGATLESGLDAFGTAQLFVAVVGVEDAMRAATAELDVPEAPPLVDPVPAIVAYAPDQYGRRGRQFTVG